MKAFRADAVDIRKATPDDASFVPEVLFDTNPSLWTYVFGGLTDEFRGTIGAWFAAKDGIASHTHAKVAAVDGEPLGLLIAYDHATQAAAFDATLGLTAGLVPEARLMELAPRFQEAGYFAPAVQDDEYYVFILSLLPAARSRGIGAKLLQSAMDSARTMGLRAVCLDAYASNPAVRFYERNGMTRYLETTMPHLADHGVGTHYRMVKIL